MSVLSNPTAVLRLPIEICCLIYDELEPEMTIQPQYPETIRQHFEPDWKAGHLRHPMLGINKITDEEIMCRYHNQADPAQPPFFARKTTFKIWYNQSRRMRCNMDRFFNSAETRRGVKHIEYIIEGYKGDPWGDYPLIDPLRDFPNLQTVRILLYDFPGMAQGERELWNAEVKERIGNFFDSEEGDKHWLGRRKELRPKWHIEEWHVIEDDC
jgi:hypothetical protein